MKWKLLNTQYSVRIFKLPDPKIATLPLVTSCVTKNQIFKSKEFGQIRTCTVKEETYFMGKDVASALGYKKPENAIAVHVDKEDKTSTLIQGSGSNYKCQAVIINESGLYSLILSSKLDSARRFKRWVTSEVLPAIRRNGRKKSSTKRKTLWNSVFSMVSNLVHPMRIELISSEPESGILSIELRVHP